ncbi:MAG TPA: glycosyltransferase [Chthoniobacterales bacterium]|jgi:GT2 family glycosyltransferase
MKERLLPVSAVIATGNRAQCLAGTLDSLLTQDLLPREFVVVDASGDDATKNFLLDFEKRVSPGASMHWARAEVAGAAPQRNQGVALSSQPFIWFFDDDISFEPDCVTRLWKAIESDSRLGGVNAMIVNQRYEPPGFVSRTMFTLMRGRREKSFAGRVIGPAINLLPEDRQDLPEVVPVQWLNTTCTIYRRKALPNPPFDSFFSGYSLMEDLALSLRVGRQWRLANVRTARIRHESQSAGKKEHEREFAKMELTNRWYVMTEILNKTRLSDFARLAAWEAFGVASGLMQRGGIRNLPKIIAGKISALSDLRKTKNRHE